MIDFFSGSLSKRSDQKEIMDDAECDDKKLINTVRQFSVLNYLFSGSRKIIKNEIISFIKRDKSREYSFLDIGAGGCDIMLWLADYCISHNYKINITCIDIDDRIIKYAGEKCKFYKTIKIIKKSVFDLDAMPDFDFIFANHFIHHFPYSDIGLILKIINKKAKISFVINDIRRSMTAYLLYTVFTGLFFHESFAFYDGRLSIRKGFLKKELDQLIKSLDLPIFVKSAFPFRLIIKKYNDILFRIFRNHKSGIVTAESE